MLLMMRRTIYVRHTAINKGIPINTIIRTALTIAYKRNERLKLMILLNVFISLAVNVSFWITYKIITASHHRLHKTPPMSWSNHMTTVLLSHWVFAAFVGVFAFAAEVFVTAFLTELFAFVVGFLLVAMTIDVEKNKRDSVYISEIMLFAIDFCIQNAIVTTILYLYVYYSWDT